jgi:hypothetical protein
MSHIHGPASVGVNAGVLFPLPLGQLNDFEVTLTPQQVSDLKAGLHYIKRSHQQLFGRRNSRDSFQSSVSNSIVVSGATGFWR